MSDAIPTPPTFDEMVALIEQNFKCYVQSTKAFTEAEIEEGWQRYKTLNHLYRDELPHIRKDTVEENWESFWKHIVTSEDGTINIEQIKKELHDFSFIMEQVPKVYCHITGNRMSKVMYHADTVISVADDYFQEQLDEAVKDEKGEQLGAVWVKASERVPVNRNLVHMNYNSQGIGLKTTGYYEPEKMTWHRQDGTLLDWHPNLKWLDESATAAPEWDSVRLIGRVKERFKELEEKQHDWRSFYCAWLEGRVDMLQQIKGWGRLSQEQADFIREANNRDLEGTAAGSEEDAVAFAEWAGWEWRRVEGKNLWENQKTLEVIKSDKLYAMFKKETGR